ncbi:T9SS type A sorting domain-containing protein [Polaribacter sp. Hel_I_88]|uniref:T9SS type A sorting domain-containing protein n=1 Tax=Polaribacter sp. Hel_I_88 TaxID=1250006 RepID=UPI00047B4BAB|nr:T9SS type A sorting domain-containing protein [Polaribacter sp. Hel_I_88]
MKIKIKYLFLLICISAYTQGIVETTYEYDNLNRLVKVVFTGEKEKNYVYDDLGNRIVLNITTLSIDAEILKNTITVYPNPTDSFLNIQLPQTILGENISIVLYDINGKQIKKSEIKVKDNSAMINVENLSKGVYLLHIKNEDKKWSQLFIKK